MNESLQCFLNSGYVDYQELRFASATIQLNAYSLLEQVESKTDKVFLLLEHGERLANDVIINSFDKAAHQLNKEIQFFWMSLEVNEIAPKLSKFFEAEKTGIYIKSDSSIVKFSPVSTENNLEDLLIKFIKQRKLYH